MIRQVFIVEGKDAEAVVAALKDILKVYEEHNHAHHPLPGQTGCTAPGEWQWAGMWGHGTLPYLNLSD